MSENEIMQMVADALKNQSGPECVLSRGGVALTYSRQLLENTNPQVARLIAEHFEHEALLSRPT